MGTIRIKNRSALTEGAATKRVWAYIIGDILGALHDADGMMIINIRKRGNTYTVTDAEESR